MGNKKEVKNKQELSPTSGARKRSSTYSRTKGHNAERKYARIFRENLGYDKCRTTREASRILDASKVDLANIPYNVQIKKGYSGRRPKPEEIFREMKVALEQNFPEEDPILGYPKLLIHDMDGREEEDVIVSMTWKDFLKFFSAYDRTLKSKRNDGERV